jgi:hypothetical protein
MSSNSIKYWNNRGYAKSPLSEEAPLLAKIKNGDYNLSYFEVMANLEKQSFKKIEADLKQYFNGSAQDWEDTIAPYRREHFQKMQSLYSRAHQDELKKLADLRDRLKSEFGLDLWEELTPICEGGPIELYNMYKQKANIATYERAKIYV